MKKTILFFATLLLILPASAQKGKTANTFPVKIDGTIKKAPSQTLYLHQRKGESFVTDSVRVGSGKFSFRVKAANPELFWFSFNRDPNTQPVCFFFADQSPVKAAIKGDSLPYSFVEGGVAQKDYLEYRGIINNFVAIQMKMQQDFNDAVQRNDANTQNAIRTEYQSLNTQYLTAIKGYIKSHPSSPVSAYVLATDLGNPNIPVEESIEAISYLDKSLESNPYFQQVNSRLASIRGTMIGYPANNFTQATPEGRKVSLSDFKGQYVLLDFWASWCRPCRMENPNVVEAYRRFKDKGFTVLGVSMDTDASRWVGAIQQDNLTWTHVSDLKGWANEAGKLYGVTGIPQNFLIDPQGKIVAKNLRDRELHEKLAEILK